MEPGIRTPDRFSVQKQLRVIPFRRWRDWQNAGHCCFDHPVPTRTEPVEAVPVRYAQCSGDSHLEVLTDRPLRAADVSSLLGNDLCAERSPTFYLRAVVLGRNTGYPPNWCIDAQPVR